jgi:dihydrofolate synthase/folylpolyglutamate synthase
MTYQQACKFLESLQKLDTPLGYRKDREDLPRYLNRAQELLDRLGNPEKDFKYIHITGTAGKGTTTALVHNMLHYAGYKVGSTTSPATTTTLERIKVGELYIAPEIFGELVESMKPAIQDMYETSEYGKPSYFDMMLALALLYFKREACQWVVLEVGMGGRYDSTNVIQNTYASLITNIGLDHTHLIGDTYMEIAQEKVGIVKPNSVLFTTEKKPEILDYFKEVCQQQKSECRILGGEGSPNEQLMEALGEYIGIDSQYIQQAKQETRLPCRFEEVSQEPRVILDGAHNVSKVGYSLAKLADIEYNKLYVLFGASHTKDVPGMLDQVVKHSNNISLCFSPSFLGGSYSLKEAQQHIINNYPEVSVSINLDYKKAFDDLRKTIGKDDCILVIGSLYVSGDVRRIWYPDEYIIKNRKSF